MVDSGANPFIIARTGKNQYDIWDIEAKLKNLPDQKSIFYSIQKFESMPEQQDGIEVRQPWFYTTGIFDGEFQKPKLGKGASSVVLRGKYHGAPAAFKFVRSKVQFAMKNEITESVKDLKKKVTEMTSIQKIKGQSSSIVEFYGHYR